MIRTGIFFYYQQGERLRDFPQLLREALSHHNVYLYDAFYPSKPKAAYELEPVPRDLLLRVHSQRMIEAVEKIPYYQAALYSAGGTVQAAEKIWTSEIDNAFVFTGCGDHHAGKNSFGGWCYLNGAALAIAKLRQEHGATRFAIVDTDAHHGDGTWDIFQDDLEVLYVCFCGAGFMDRNNKANITVPYYAPDEDYLRIVEQEFVPRCQSFRPELLFWNWGYDGTIGDYGDMGLSPGCHLKLARVFKSMADSVCQSKLVVVLCGGHSRATANYAIPQIISCLAELD